VSKTVSKTAKMDSLQLAREANKERRLNALLEFYRANPSASRTEAAR